jgi:uncharacterized protein YecT (DUF1311 family)
MRLLLIILALAGVPSLAHAQRSATADERCGQLASHIETRDCLEQMEALSRRTLGEAQKELASNLQRWNQEPEYRKASTDALRLANASFEQFRDAQCDYVASLAAGGNAAGDRRYLCQIELNDQRARHLKAEIDRLR